MDVPRQRGPYMLLDVGDLITPYPLQTWDNKMVYISGKIAANTLLYPADVLTKILQSYVVTTTERHAATSGLNIRRRSLAMPLFIRK